MDQWINMTTKCKTIRLPDESDWDRPLLTRTGGGGVDFSLPWLAEGHVGVALQGRRASCAETSERCLG